MPKFVPISPETLANFKVQPAEPWVRMVIAENQEHAARCWQMLAIIEETNGTRQHMQHQQAHAAFRYALVRAQLGIEP